MVGLLPLVAKSFGCQFAKIIFYSHLPAMEGKKPHWKLADVMRRDMKEP